MSAIYFKKANGHAFTTQYNASRWFISLTDFLGCKSFSTGDYDKYSEERNKAFRNGDDDIKSLCELLSDICYIPKGRCKDFISLLERTRFQGLLSEENREKIAKYKNSLYITNSWSNGVAQKSNAVDIFNPMEWDV